MSDQEGVASTPLELRVQRDHDGSGSTTVIEVAGDVDLRAAPELVKLARAELDPPPQHLMISVGGATFVDSGGLRAVLELQQLSDHLGVDFGLADVPPRIRRLLEMTGLSHLIGRDD